MLQNRRWVGGKSYTVPSAGTYPYQWFWDSCFHSIILRYLEPERGLDELGLLLEHHLDLDFIPHMIYWGEGPTAHDLHYYFWGVEGGSSITQPPMVAQALLRYLDVPEARARIQSWVPLLERHFNYLEDERRDDQSGLFAIINPDESGLDNLPSYDEILNLPPNHHLADHLKKRAEIVDAYRECGHKAHAMKDIFYVFDVLFNTIIVAEFAAFAQILETLSYPHDQAAKWQNASQTLASAMRDYMLEGGLMWNLDKTYTADKVLTWTVLAPLYAGIYTNDEARAIEERFFSGRSSELWSEWGILSTASSELSYDPDPIEDIIGGFWRGPIWASIHWFIYHGCRHYQMDKLANNLVQIQKLLIAKSGFREIYSPIDGEGMGALDFTWPGLILDMIER